MAKEIYKLVDKWTELFYENKDKIIEEASSVIKEYQVPVAGRYHLGNPEELRFEFVVVFHPQGYLEFNGSGRIAENPFEVVQYRCFVNYIEEFGFATMEDEIVLLVRDGKIQTAPPGIKMAETMKAIAEAVFKEEHTPRLHSTALDELMMIQQEYMVKEKDTEGLLNLRETYFGLKNEEDKDNHH